jgi:mono/diheme cytochrome c family protein
MRLFHAAFLITCLLGPALCRADGQETFEKKCATCHGKDGKGQTKMGKDKQVSDLTDPAIQAKFTDEQAIKEVSEGNAEKKHPAFKDKLSPDEIKAAVSATRAFAPKAAAPAK